MPDLEGDRENARLYEYKYITNTERVQKKLFLSFFRTTSSTITIGKTS